MSRWYRDGELVDSIPIDDRAVQYGDGLFETVAIRNGAPRLWDYHVERLQSGCARLGLRVPIRNQLELALANAMDCDPGDLTRGVARVIVSAGAGPRGYRRSDGGLTLLVGLNEAAALPVALYDDGVRIRICATRLAIQPQLAGIKTLNRIEQVLARAEWHDDTVFEGLTLDTDDRLICGTMSNVFLVAGQSLITPGITRCGVAGVMRRHILTLLDEAGIDCDVRDVSVTELWESDGACLTNSQFGLLPVRRCGHRAWECPPMLVKIRDYLRQSGIEEPWD